jgi:hypothetical protein
LKKFIYISFVTFIFYFSLGCSKDSRNEIVLAKTAGKKLTYSELSARVDTTSVRSRERVNDFINNWINVSILFEEAKEADVTGSDEYKTMIEQARQDIAVNLLLKQEVYDKDIYISNAEIQNYYNRHRNEYFLSIDIVNISYVVFVNENIAVNFLQGISEKNRLIKEVESFITSNAQTLVIAYKDSVFFKRSELYPPDVWKATTALQIGEISRPIRTFDGYMIIKLNSYQKAGEIGSLLYAKDDIIERLTIDKKKELYMNYLRSLRTKYRTENYFEISTNESN